MYRFHLTKIVLKDGTTVEPAQVTLIVGPNNTGKSRLLKELAHFLTSLGIDKLLLSDVECLMPGSLDELRENYDVEPRQVGFEKWTWGGLEPSLCKGFSFPRSKIDWPRAYEHFFPAVSQEQRGGVFLYFGRQLVAHLTTEQRLQLVKENDSSSREYEPENLLQELYHSNKSKERVQELRSIIKDAFGLDIVFDFSGLRSLLFRIGGDFTDLPGDPRDAKRILSQRDKLDDQGDGMRAFVGIVVALLTARRDVFLIDEPETFLHPPQSFRIGRFLGEQSKQERQVIAATHSADVLRGVLSSGAQVRILRIDRTGNTNSFRILDTQQVRDVAADPLLSSARVLDGLFFSGAVVVEADADARFYQSVSTRCRQDLDLHFVNADNKQTVPRIMGIYQNMGVRCAGIVDFDVLNDATEFSKQLEAIHLQEPEKSRMMSLREQIAKVAKESPPGDRLEAVEDQLKKLLSEVSALREQSFGSEKEAKQQQGRLLGSLERRFRQIMDAAKEWKELKQRGRDALPATERAAFDELSGTCAERGLFINPCGELESMLEEYAHYHTTDKKTWITKALRALPGLVVDDVKNPWALMKGIHDYLSPLWSTVSDIVRPLS